MTENKSFKINAIKMLITRNYNVDISMFDLESEIDDSLTMSENWSIIKPKVLILWGKKW